MESNDSKTKPEIILARARVVAECAEKLYDHANKLSEVVKKENPAPASQNYRRAESLDRLMLNLNAAISDMLDESPAHTVTPKKDHFGEGYKETHEAYGSIRAIRTSGFRKLFGSVLDRHSHYISVEITRASFDARDLDDSRHWSEHGYDNEIVRLAMSASQWADFISNMQDASGVPCTLDYVRGRRMAEVPDAHHSRSEKFFEDFLRGMSEAPRENADAWKNFQKVVDELGLSKTKSAALLKAASVMHFNHDKSVKYVFDRFHESAEKAVNAARAEVDATIGGMVSRLGLGRLREIVAGDAPSENERKLIGAVVDAPTLGTGDDR